MKKTITSCITALLAAAFLVLSAHGDGAPPADNSQPKAKAPAETKETAFDPIPQRQPEFTGEYFSSADVDTKPVSKGTPAKPAYPKELKKAAVSGEATVAFIVSTEGVPGQIQIIKATHRGFGDAVAKCVTKWRFKPAIKDGKPVNCLLVYPIEFEVPL